MIEEPWVLNYFKLFQSRREKFARVRENIPWFFNGILKVLVGGDCSKNAPF